MSLRRCAAERMGNFKLKQKQNPRRDREVIGQGFPNRTRSVMKYNISYLWIIIIGILALQVSCKKNSTGPEPPPPSQPAPEISSIEPDSGQAGDQVTITGKNFSSTESENTVKFGGATATVSSASATQLVTTVPNNAGSGAVEVTVNGKTATGPDFTLLMEPVITAIEPDSAEAGREITITGEHFSSTPDKNTVTFSGDVAGTVNNASATELKVTVPQGAGSGPVTVEVNGLSATSAMNFTLKVPPKITGFTPASAKYGEHITITGENFGPTPSDNRVEFGIGAAVIVSASETELVVEVPKAAGNGSILVRNHHGLNHASAEEFIYELTVTVSTVAGNGTAGYVDGPASSAQLDRPMGIELGPAGDIYFTEAGNHTVRRISAGGQVSTVAGTGTAGFKNGSVDSAQFNSPQDITFDADGNIYIADNLNHRIRKILTSSSEVVTLAGNGTQGYVDNSDGQLAEFSFPRGILFGNDGNFYVAESGNDVIRKITLGGGTSTLAGDGTEGYADGTGTAAKFKSPSHLYNAGQILYVAATENYRIRTVNFATAEVSTLAGSGSTTSSDGPLLDAGIAAPWGITAGGKWGFYFSEVGSGSDYNVKIIRDGLVTTIAGNGQGFTDGDGSVAQFYTPFGLALVQEGTADIIYVADFLNHAIRKITVE